MCRLTGYFSIIAIATATSNPAPDRSNPPFTSNNTTAASAISETPTVYLAASKTSEVPAADVSFAVSSFLTHVRNRENYFTQNQISQLNHSLNTELDRSIEITLQQTPASSRRLDDQNSSNATNDTFHSVVEELSPHHQQLVSVIPRDNTEKETLITETSPAVMLEDKLASQQQQPQPHNHIDRDSSSETFTLVSPSDHSTAQQQQRS